MLNSPISSDSLLVPGLERPGNKIMVSKFLLQISIRDIHNDLIRNSIIYQLKESIDETTGKPLISGTSLHIIFTNNVIIITDRYKHMCGCKICVIICFMQASINSYWTQHLKLLTEQARAKGGRMTRLYVDATENIIVMLTMSIPTISTCIWSPEIQFWKYNASQLMDIQFRIYDGSFDNAIFYKYLTYQLTSLKLPKNKQHDAFGDSWTLPHLLWLITWSLLSSCSKNYMLLRLLHRDYKEGMGIRERTRRTASIPEECTLKLRLVLIWGRRILIGKLQK